MRSSGVVKVTCVLYMSMEDGIVSDLVAVKRSATEIKMIKRRLFLIEETVIVSTWDHNGICRERKQCLGMSGGTFIRLSCSLLFNKHVKTCRVQTSRSYYLLVFEPL